ncbi:MAG: 1,4-dihydroxy-2-naphthoate polyprenyltransferase, partial [Haemophilus parainfluenzae]
PWLFLFLLAFPLLLKHALFVYRSKEPAVLRPMLAQMSMISLFINILFSLGLLIG